MEEAIPKLMIVLVTLTLALVLDRLASRPLRRLLDKSALPSATIFVNIVRGIIWSLALMSILRPVFGVEPTAFLTAVGVGSVALSFGLQTTVSNIIGGLTITAGKVIELDDWVTVGGVTGQVTDITWRHTVITDILGSQTVVPNSEMNSGQIVRLSAMAAHKTNFAVEIVPGADLDAVVAEATELVRTSLREAGYAWEGAESLVIMDGMNSFGGQMNVVLFVNDPTKAALARDVATRSLDGCAWVAGLE